jgi:hypothetical protein
MRTPLLPAFCAVLALPLTVRAAALPSRPGKPDRR